MSARTASRLAWAGWAASVALAVLGELLLAITPAASLPTGFRFHQVFPVSMVAFSTVGALIVSRRPENRVGWLACAIGLFANVWPFATDYVNYGVIAKPGALPAGEWMAWLQNWEWLPPTMLILVFLPLVFPNGRLLSPRWRIVGWLAVAITVLFVVRAAFAPTVFFGNIENPIGISAVTGIGSLIDQIVDYVAIVLFMLSAASLILRFRRGNREERQQLKWLVSAVAVVAIATIPSIVLRVPVGQSPGIYAAFSGLATLAPPISIGIAVLKYRLYDIDVVINKALVFGALAAFITAVYVTIVVGIGALVGAAGSSNLALSIVATAIVAVAFQPVREWVQRLANRLVYGKRATPYEVMADFAERMAGALSVDEVLPKMAEAAARGVVAVKSRVRLFLPDAAERSVSWPLASTDDRLDRVLPVTYRGEGIGEIAVAKAAGEPLTPAEEKLLADLASQAGLVLHNVRLTAELQARLAEISARAAELRASRQRIVAARDAERRRLERDIHDGAERQLASTAEQLRLAEQELTSDPSRVAVVLDQLTEQANTTLEELRDLARGIYPPLLRDQGLTSALRAQAAKTGVVLEIATDGLGRYPSEVESAVYFCCVEGLRGVPGGATIRLAQAADWLEFSVQGSGFTPDGRLQDMEDRVEALGGSLEVRDGTTLTGRIPIGVLEPVG